MKNSQIHNGLPQKEIRDFLAISLGRNFELGMEPPKELKEIGKEGNLEWGIRNAENQVLFHQSKLQGLKERLALRQILKMNSWEQFDVSEETDRDLPHIFHQNFIGTSSEFKTLIKSLKK